MSSVVSRETWTHKFSCLREKVLSTEKRRNFFYKIGGSLIELGGMAPWSYQINILKTRCIYWILIVLKAGIQFSNLIEINLNSSLLIIFYWEWIFYNNVILFEPLKYFWETEYWTGIQVSWFIQLLSHVLIFISSADLENPSCYYGPVRKQIQNLWTGSKALYSLASMCCEN